MTRDIDWPMTVGTLLLAAFLGWVVLAMYRPSLPARALGGWLHSSNVTQQVTGAQAQPAAQRQP